MRLIPGQDYYTQLVETVRQARHRVTLAAMVVAEGPAMHQLFVELERAARRGVAVHVLVDIYTKHWLARTAKMERWQVTRDSFERIERAGGRVSYYGQIGLNPVAGRCHVKIAVIDDAAYSFGGINLTDISFEQNDYMLGMRGAVLADQLDEIVSALATGHMAADQALMVNATDTILLDAGTPGQSIIYERACDLVAAASRVYYVSQYGPSGRLGHLMRRAEATLYFDRIWQMPPPANLLLMRDKLAYRLINSYTRPTYLHAKFILAELPDSTKQLIAGSNNFNWDAVTYGTKEIALQSTNEALWQTFCEYLTQNIAS